MIRPRVCFAMLLLAALGALPATALRAQTPNRHDAMATLPSAAERAICPARRLTSSEVRLVAAMDSDSDPMQPMPAQMHRGRAGRATDEPRESDAGKRYLLPPAIPDAPRPLNAFGTALASPSGSPLTLDELESMACGNNPTLLQARAQVEGALGKAIQAGLWPNPTLRYSAEQIGVEGTIGEFHGASVEQRIVTARKLDLSREKFLAQTRVAEWMALAQQYRVLNEVRLHYFRACGRQELLGVQRELLKNAEDELVTTREMYNVGQAIRAEVHQANVALQQQRLTVMMAENDYRQAFEELTAMVGIDLAPAPLATPLEGDLAPIDWEEALARLIQESPQMMAARCKLDADSVTIRREIAEPVPDLIVEAGAGYNFEADQTVGVAGLSLEVPLFDWNQGTIRQAEADYARQRGEVRRTELWLRRDLARQYRLYLTALQHVHHYRDVILPESYQAYELLLQSYKRERTAWPEVLAAEQQYFTLRKNYIQNLIAWRESEVLITGYLLHNGLEAAPQPIPPGHMNSVPKPR